MEINDKLIITKSTIKRATRNGSALSEEVSYTGLGFKPKEIHAFMVVNGTYYMSMGFSDKTGVSDCLFTSGSGVFRTTTNLVTYSNETNWAQNATIKSYDEDGFTLSWYRVGTPIAGELKILFLCK